MLSSLAAIYELVHDIFPPVEVDEDGVPQPEPGPDPPLADGLLAAASGEHAGPFADAGARSLSPVPDGDEGGDVDAVVAPSSSGSSDYASSSGSTADEEAEDDGVVQGVAGTMGATSPFAAAASQVQADWLGGRSDDADDADDDNEVGGPAPAPGDGSVDQGSAAEGMPDGAGGEGQEQASALESRAS